MKTVSYITGEGRTDRPEYPEIAIREAVANALMHRDYSPEALGSQVQVNMFIDRIEILSPGGLFGIVTVDNIGQYGASSSRNQRLSRILESAPYPQGYPEFGFVVENKGTGFAQIQAALKNCSMPPAEPKDNLALFSLTMRKASESAMMQTSAETTEVATDRNRIVDFIEKNGMVSSSEAAQLLGVSRATALRKLKELVAEGIIKPTANIGRSVKYVL